jgi:hypothetical protein
VNKGTICKAIKEKNTKTSPAAPALGWSERFDVHRRWRLLPATPAEAMCGAPTTATRPTVRTHQGRQTARLPACVPDPGAGAPQRLRGCRPAINYYLISAS